MQNITSEDLAWLDDAVGYGNVASVGAAYGRLLEFRRTINAGSSMAVSLGNALQEFDSTDGFDSWVRSRYPVFVDDVLHPAFNR